MAQQTREGTLKHVKLANETPKWWTYDIAFSDGEVLRVLLPKDSGFNLPEHTDKPISCYLKGDNWFVAYKDIVNGNTGGGKKQYGNTNNGSANTGAGNNRKGDSYNNYWDEKYKYEVDVKDPETAVRSLFISVQQFYSAAIPNMKRKPADTIECDAMLNEAVAKATEIYARMKEWCSKQGESED